MESWRAAIAARVVEAAALPPGADAAWTSCGGSALNALARLAIAGRRFFVKTNAPARFEMLEAEADGLAALGRNGAIRVPEPVACGVDCGVAFLALEWLDIEGGGRDAALGRALARMHRHTDARFGWHRDNAIGTTPQPNSWTDDWPRFFRDRRLAPQLGRAARNGYGGALQRDGERLLEAVAPLLSGHAPAASLVHGDLWSGNAGRVAGGEPVVFDPAAYFGDRETDLAMSELFGGFGADFYAAYDDTWPREPGYPTRRTLYNLYHVLNHLNLFGGGYAAHARAMMGALLALVR